MIHGRGATRPPPVTIARLAATVLGLGRLPGGGTVTAALVCVAALIPEGPGPLAFLAAGVAVSVSGAFAAEIAERELGHDAPAITVDEAAGMLLTLAAAPPAPWAVLVAFLSFRAFDILKPPPVAALQSLPGGLGIVADDVAAACYAALLLLLLRLL